MPCHRDDTEIGGARAVRAALVPYTPTEGHVCSIPWRSSGGYRLTPIVMGQDQSVLQEFCSPACSRFELVFLAVIRRGSDACRPSQA